MINENIGNKTFLHCLMYPRGKFSFKKKGRNACIKFTEIIITDQLLKSLQEQGVINKRHFNDLSRINFHNLE